MITFRHGSILFMCLCSSSCLVTSSTRKGTCTLLQVQGKEPAPTLPHTGHTSLHHQHLLWHEAFRTTPDLCHPVPSLHTMVHCSPLYAVCTRIPHLSLGYLIKSQMAAHCRLDHHRHHALASRNHETALEYGCQHGDATVLLSGTRTTGKVFL